MRQLPPTGAVERAGDDDAVGASDHQRAAPRDQPPAGRRLQPRPAFVGALQQRDIVGVLEVGHAHDPRGSMTRPAIVHGAELLDTEHVDATAGEGGSGRRAHRAEADDDHVVAIHGAERKHRLAVERVRSIYARRIGEQRAGDGDLDALRRRAEALGAETFYWDDQGNYHDADPESLRRVVEVLEADVATGERRTPAVVIGSGGTLSVGTGIDDAALTLADGTTVALDVTGARVDVPDPLPVGCHTLTLAGPGVEEATTIVTPPAEMPTSPALAGRAAMFAPAYALWEHDAPLPSFTHLASLGSMLPTLGVDALITLPLYAAFLDEPFDPSPYAPISRLHWNEAYLDDGWTAERARPAHRRPHRLARRSAGAGGAQLLDAVGTIPATLATEVRHWVAANPDIADYARFRAKVAVDPTDATRPTDVVEASHQLAQYLCHVALSQLHETGRAAFALDLPIGSHPLGYETWANPDLFATGMGVGAPPDTMYPDGQNWGFPPQLPGAAERSGFALWRAVVRRCGRYASLLRIDHVLGVHRLWWIPDGVGPDKGVYVRYPRTTLLAVIAAEAACAGTTVVGEDLGTVPEAITEAMQEWNMLGLYAEQTQLGAGSGRCPEDTELPTIPARTVAGLRTHDMEPFAMLYARWRPRRLPTQAAARPRPPRRPVGSRAADGRAHPPRRLRCLPRLRRSRRPARRGHPAQHPRQGVADDLAAAAAPADVRDARRHRGAPPARGADGAAAMTRDASE